MAMRCPPPHFLMHRLDDAKKTAGRVYMNLNSQSQPERAPPVQLKSYRVPNKVFEDKLRGIVCYQDDNGELTCEGYDEGPRYTPKPSPDVCHQRIVEIPDFSPTIWLQTAKDAGSVLVPNGVAIKKQD